MVGRVVIRGVGVSVLLFLSWGVLARGTTPSPSPGLLLGLLDNANLIFHEAGHVLFTPFGEFMHYLGGSLMQVIVPATCAVYFWQRRQKASSAVTVFWTGQSLTNVAVYVADGRRIALPLIGGDHDWNYLLGRLTLLNRAEGLGRLVFVFGFLTIFVALILLLVDLLHSWDKMEGSTGPTPSDAGSRNKLRSEI